MKEYGTSNLEFWDKTIAHCRQEEKDYILKILLRDNKGEWIEEEDFIDTIYRCSKCREVFTTIDSTPEQNLMNFCPNCGADMRKGK